MEDYYHIEAAYRTIPRTAWDTQPSRVERNTALLLNLFHRHNRKATFFVLGYVARRFPQLAKSIVDAGHEVASHGSGHDRLHRLTPATFREDLLNSKKLLEDQTGKPVIGYRAPTFSVVRQTAWAIDVLAEAGFGYDSSIFPVTHHWYGVPYAPRHPFYVRSSEKGSTLLEVPPLTWRILGRNMPVAGGGYFRLLPLTFMRRGLEQARRKERPAVLYFHPWEFDPDMPRMALSAIGRIRTYTGLKASIKRLESIISADANWSTMIDALPAFEAQAKQQKPFTLQTT